MLNKILTNPLYTEEQEKDFEKLVMSASFVAISRVGGMPSDKFDDALYTSFKEELIKKLS